MSSTDKLQQAERLANSLFSLHSLAGWSFSFNRRKSDLGLCLESRKTIQLSVYFVRLNDMAAIRETLLHEIAHALAGARHGHDAVWRAKCLQIGAKPERLCFSAAMPDGKWQAHCFGCGQIHHRHRRPKRLSGWWCRCCGRDRGQLKWEKVA